MNKEELENRVDIREDTYLKMLDKANKFDKQKEVLDKIKEITKENIDDEFYINLTKKEKALYKIHELLEEIE